MEIILSPCPNDVFILSGLILKKIPTTLNLSFHFADIQTLNELLLQKKYPIIKASFAIYPEVYKEYQILGIGSALGYGVGPILVSKMFSKEMNFTGYKVALPGKYTTAHFLWNYFYKFEVEKVFLSYEAIIPALLEGKVDLGILIHEGRFVYEKYGLYLISDLGDLWEKRHHCPLPLGGFFIKRNLPEAIKKEIYTSFRRSLDYAWAHQDEVFPLLKQYAQELDREVIFKHIETYVNQYTYKLNDEAKKGLSIFFESLGLEDVLEAYIWEVKDGIS